MAHSAAFQLDPLPDDWQQQLRLWSEQRSRIRSEQAGQLLEGPAIPPQPPAAARRFFLPEETLASSSLQPDGNLSPNGGASIALPSDWLPTTTVPQAWAVSTRKASPARGQQGQGNPTPEEETQPPKATWSGAVASNRERRRNLPPQKDRLTGERFGLIYEENPTAPPPTQGLAVRSPTPHSAPTATPVAPLDVLASNPAFDLIGLTSMRQNPRYADLDGSGFTVAVLDTGVDAQHPLLTGHFAGFLDFTQGRSHRQSQLITNPNLSYDYDGHGTHVAGTTASTDSSIGVANGSNFIGLAVLGAQGGSDRDIIEALYWVLENHRKFNIAAINMSLGISYYLSSQEEAFQVVGGTERSYANVIDALEREGVAVIVAAGNSYDDPITEFPVGPKDRQGIGSPAIHATINVGAVWQDAESQTVNNNAFRGKQIAGPDRIAVFSNRLDSSDNNLDTIMAPGAMIASTYPGNKIINMAGTSMASPHIAGVVAVLQEAALKFAGRQLTVAELTKIIRSTSDGIFDGDDEADVVTNSNTTYGRININKAVALIDQTFSATNPTPTPDPTDLNGTLARAINGGIVDGQPIDPFYEAIGQDGGKTQVGGKDVDLYRVEVTVAGTLFAETLGVSGVSINTVLRIFSSTGAPIAANDNANSTTLLSRATAAVQPGTYYIGVSGFNNSNYNPNQSLSGKNAAADGQGNYGLRFGLESTDLNGLLQNAVDLSLGNERDASLLREGRIGFDYGNPVGGDDVDLFRVIIPDNGTLFIDVDTPFEDGEYIDSYLRVFDEDGHPINFTNGDPVASDDDLGFDIQGEFNEFTDPLYPEYVFDSATDREFFSGHETDSFLGAVVERGGVYYIGVSSYSNRSYDPNTRAGRNANGETGNYNLSLQFFSHDRNGTFERAVDLGSASLSNQSGTIGFDTDQTTSIKTEVGDIDVDMVKIQPSMSGILHVDINAYDNPGISTPVDAIVTLFSATGERLAVMDDDGSRRDPDLYAPVTAGVTYYVGISGYGNASYDPLASGSGSVGDTGDYEISLSYSTGSLPSSNDSISSPSVQNNPVTLPGAGAPPVRISAELGQDGQSYVGNKDIDLYRLRVDKSGVYEIFTESMDEYGADTFMRLFDSKGKEIAFNDDQDSRTHNSFLAATLTAGATVYVGVSGYSKTPRSYNPVTGIGAVTGDTGTYDIVFRSTVPVIQLEVAPASASEDGNTNLVYTFSRSGANSSALKVNYTVGGTATLGTDYTGIAPSGRTKSVTFAAGASTAKVTVDPKADTTIELNETVALTLAAGSGYAIGTAIPVVGTLNNDDISSSTSYTLTANQSSLRLLGNNPINGTGNHLNNSIIGNGNNNKLAGLAGADILTGGGTRDSDQFVYTSLIHSLLGTGNSFDQITDFTSKDRLAPPLSIHKTRLTSSQGNIKSLSAASIATLLTSSKFLAHSVAAFTVNGKAGTFIAMNDARAGYQANTDAIVFLQNYTISGSNFVDFI